MGHHVDTRGVMYDQSYEAPDTVESGHLPMRTLAMAVLAPFGVMALLASPLLLAALGNLTGL